MYIVKQIWGPIIKETGPTPPDPEKIALKPMIRGGRRFAPDVGGIGPEVFYQFIQFSLISGMMCLNLK
jgi:hypothetical protein